MVELRHLKYFLAVAEELNFRKAAEKLFISQPGLSRQIKQLEENYGVQLFERTKKKVMLTAAGEYLKEEAVVVFEQMVLIKRNVKLLDAGEMGEFRIGFVGSAMQKIVPEFLLKINKKYKGVKVSLKEMSISEQVTALQKEQLDMGFVRLSKAPLGMQIKTVFKDTFSIVLPKNHELDEFSFKNVGQLRAENFIMFSSAYSPLYYDKIVSICQDSGFTPNISHKSVHAQTIFKLVESGLGVAIIPSALQEGYNLEVKFIEIKNIRQQALLSVLWKKESKNKLLQQIKQLID